MNRSRTAAVSLEFLLGMVVLFAISLAVFQSFMIGLTQQTLVTAATEAARSGAQLGTAGTIAVAAAGAAATAEANVGVQRLELFDNNPAWADGVIVVERRVGVAASEVVTLGAGPACAAGVLPTTPLEPNQLRVTLCFPLIDATDPSGCGNPVGNWLSGFGFDLAGCTISYSSLANLE